MISRRIVRCPGCQQKITLRLSVGPADHQPFYFVCSNCNTATRGALDASQPPKLELKLEDGEELFENIETSQVITIDSTFPHVPGTRTMMDRGGSPFIHMHMLLGDAGLLRLQRAYQDFPALVAANKKPLERLIRFYLDRNWAAFDAGLKDLWPKEHAPKYEWQRHDIVHRLLDLLTAPLWEPSLPYPRMKANWNGLVSPATKYSSELKSFVLQWETNPSIRLIQETLFECINLYTSNYAAWLPGVAISLLPAPQAQHQDLRVFRDDFAALRDVYIRTFEACHAALDLLLPLANVSARGDAESFQAQPEVTKPAKILAQFKKLRAFEKQQYFTSLPVWHELWPYLLDRDLRNSIGHASVRHDLKSGTLKEGDTIIATYPAFLAKTHRLIHPLLAVTNALKLPLVYASMLAKR